jgi:hypothetical protein
MGLRDAVTVMFSSWRAGAGREAVFAVSAVIAMSAVSAVSAVAARSGGAKTVMSVVSAVRAPRALSAVGEVSDVLESSEVGADSTRARGRAREKQRDMESISRQDGRQLPRRRP